MPVSSNECVVSSEAVIGPTGSSIPISAHQATEVWNTCLKIEDYCKFVQHIDTSYLFTYGFDISSNVGMLSQVMKL